MKHKFSKRILSTLLAFVMVVGLIPAAAIPARAQNIIGLQSASYMRAGEDIVLFGDTTLVMDRDLTVLSIQGDYNLTIEGSGKLTVNGGGNGIDVKSLHCTSDLFIQTGWHAIEVSETVYIHNADSFIVGGIYAEGDIDIRSNNATIAGNGNAIFSNGGNITLSGGTFDIGANGIAVAAETGGIYMTGAFTVNSNNDRTINAARGEMVVNGSLKSVSGAQFDPEVHFINRDFFSIGAAKGFNFYGTTLEVTGLGGIDAGANASDADISITADSVSIITERYYAMYGSYIYVDSDELWLENEGSEENENVTFNFGTIFGSKDVTLHSESGGIVGEYAIYAGENLSLNGTFAIGADTDNKTWSAVLAYGRAEVTGNLHVITDDILCVYAEDGFSFNGSTLELEGYQGIAVQNGDVNIVAESTEIVASDYCAIRDEMANDSVCNVYIDSDYLWLQGGKDEVHNSGCVDVRGNVTIYSDEATIMGNYGIDAGGDIFLDGNFVALGYLQEAIRSQSRVEARGKLSLATDGEHHCLTAQEFMFDGSTLVADGHAGINSNFTDITADSVVITTDVGTTISGYEVYVNANYLWAENKATKLDSDWLGQGESQFGISAVSKLSLTVKGGTVIGYDAALFVYDRDKQFDHHYIYVDGALTAVSRTGSGMYVPQGSANLYGGSIVSVGETYGVHADVLTFEGDSLRIDGNTGVYAISGVELAGQDIKITAFGERNSGIWCENGPVTLEGKVVINTSGWYGINAGGDLTLGKGYFAISGPEDNAQAVKTAGTLTLDGTLEIIQPDGGHVNGNEIYGAGDSPALELEMYSAIRDVSLLIDGPRDGKLPDRNAFDVYFLDPRCTVEEIIWYEDGEELVSQDAVFRAGHSYTVRIIISADDPYRFIEGVMGKVNDKNVSTGLTEKKIMRLTADLGECPEAIDTVELSIKAPEEGKTPSTGVTAGSSKYGVYSRNVRWGVSTDGINFVMMASGEKFVGGKYYRVFMDVTLAGNQYKFPVTTATGSVQPDVVATVNGNPAVVEKAYDQDPQTVITVYFDFGKCNDFIIEEVTIVDVVAPVAGEHPTYTVNMFGTGYHVDTTRNSYEDIYWKNPPEKWYYVKNGVSWWDVTDGGYDYVYENDVFLPGHQYQCTVYVATDDGYEFVNDVYAEVWPAATMNGNSATIMQEGSGLMWEQRVSYTFTCEPRNVNTIMINELTEPVVGKTPDYSANVMVPEAYLLDPSFGTNGIQWYNCEGMELLPTDTFMAGEPYCIAIRVISVQTDGVDLVKFSNDMEFNINGTPVTTYGYWDKVVVENNVVTAYYTFRKASSAPVLGMTVSGTVSSRGDASEDILMQLTRWGESEPAYETVVRGNTASYSFDAVDSGVYTLRVLKTGHVTVEYMVIVNAGNVTQDVTLSLKGDLDLDGSVSISDVTTLLNVIAGKTNLEEGVDGDLDADGSVSISDVTTLLNVIAGKTTL